MSDNKKTNPFKTLSESLEDHSDIEPLPKGAFKYLDQYNNPKFIFLDIDGVLNHTLFYEEKSQQQRYDEVGYPLCDLDPEKVDILNKLIEQTGAQVVISSTWRKGRSIQTLQELFEKVGFTGKILDITPVILIKGMSTPRGVEILSWQRENNYEDKPYVILDDDSDMLYWQRNNFLLIDGYCGLTPNVVHRAIQILNK